MSTPGRIRSVFWNDDERRLRTPWRLVAAAVVFAVVLTVFLSVAARVTVEAGADEEFFLEFWGLASLLGVSAVGFVFALWIVARYVDRRRPSDYGLRVDGRWWKDLGFGLALGAVLPTLIFVVGVAAGWYDVTGFAVSDGSFVAAFVGIVVVFVLVGVYEEVLFRGWLLTNLGEGLRGYGEGVAVGGAVAVSSVLFGVLHLGNPGATVASAAVITLAGVLLAVSYVLTGELGVAVGFHVTWNLFKGSVYGFEVSGLDIPVTVVETEAVGPEAATGGGFGPEGGVLGGAAVVVGTVAVVWWARRHGETVVDEKVTTPDLRTSASETQ